VMLVLSRAGDVHWGGWASSFIGLASMEVIFPHVGRDRVAVISAGGQDEYGHFLLATTSGCLFSWGDGSHGQLGLGTTTSHDSPQRVQTPGVMCFTSVAAGDYHSLGVADGHVYSFGNCRGGVLGLGSPYELKLVPTLVHIPTRMLSVAAGTISSLAQATDGMVYGWGDGDTFKARQIHWHEENGLKIMTDNEADYLEHGAGYTHLPHLHLPEQHPHGPLRLYN
jgi:alpha-tubulin suppressor-like RCC1 family protein